MQLFAAALDNKSTQFLNCFRSADTRRWWDSWLEDWKVYHFWWLLRTWTMVRRSVGQQVLFSTGDWPLASGCRFWKTSWSRLTIAACLSCPTLFEIVMRLLNNVCRVLSPNQISEELFLWSSQAYLKFKFYFSFCILLERLQIFRFISV